MLLLLVGRDPLRLGDTQLGQHPEEPASILVGGFVGFPQMLELFVLFPRRDGESVCGLIREERGCLLPGTVAEPPGDEPRLAGSPGGAESGEGVIAVDAVLLAVAEGIGLLCRDDTGS